MAKRTDTDRLKSNIPNFQFSRLALSPKVTKSREEDIADRIAKIIANNSKVVSGNYSEQTGYIFFPIFSFLGFS